MKAHLTQIGEMAFEARAEGRPPIVLDAAGKGDDPKGPSPFQAALLAAMGCAASDIVWILRKQKAPLAKLEIEAEAERAETEPRVLTTVHLHYKVYGEGVSEAAVKRAIDLSTEKYCSVGIMLRRAGVAWENTFEILPGT
ncbi:MAG: hypothetical protein A3K66_01540 [Euryarchaeota archaeon RBG_16_67_27]|nr:MAG: hypothetical protein A3K66_01540 [Euryarchaeota archaeon RBG_16_67_27]